MVELGSPTVVSATSAVTYLHLPESSSDLTLYAATFDATVAATFASCGITLDGTETAPPTAGLFASAPFDARSVSTIEMDQVLSLPMSVRYQRACGPPTPCAATSVEIWPLSSYPLGGVLAVSDDLALAETLYPTDPTSNGTPDLVLRLDWASRMVATSTFTLEGARAFVPIHGHALAATKVGDVLEVDPQLRVVTKRSFGFQLSGFSVGPEGSMLLVAAQGCGATSSVLQGTWSSTAVHMIACSIAQVDQVAADRSDWSAYAADLKVHVLSGTTAVPDLPSALGDVIATLTITPSTILAGPRQLDWSLLTRSSLTWTQIGRPFTSVARSAVIAPMGSILTGGDGGAVAIRSKGSWCPIQLDTHLAVRSISLAPSGRIAFAAMGSDTDGALLRLSLPPEL
jgi:hypothetical protein